MKLKTIDLLDIRKIEVLLSFLYTIGKRTIFWGIITNFLMASVVVERPLYIV